MNIEKAILKYIPHEPLLYLAAAFQAIQFGLAGSIYFGLTGWFIGGLGGIVVNFSIAKSASRINDIAKARKPLAWTGFIALMVLSPIAVAPAGYLQMSVITTFWLRVAASIVWAIIPDAAILLTGAITGKSLVKDTDETPKPKRTKADSAPQSVASAKESAQGATTPSKYPRRCEFCAADVPDSIAVMKNSNAVGGHMKSNHPDKCKKKSVTFFVSDNVDTNVKK